MLRQTIVSLSRIVFCRGKGQKTNTVPKVPNGTNSTQFKVSVSRGLQAQNYPPPPQHTYTLLTGTT